MKRHSLLFALFIFLSSLSMQAEETAGKWSERYNVTAITMDEGLPHNFVDDILKDSQGFLWIATRGEGIARYDGYEFTAFNMGSTHTKLRSNFINKLCEDNCVELSMLPDEVCELINLDPAEIEKQRLSGRLRFAEEENGTRHYSIVDIINLKDSIDWKVINRQVESLSFEEEE